MKRHLTIILVLAAAVLAGCSAPRTSSITDGQVTGLTSAEAVTLTKQEIRRAKVEDVQTNQKPIVKLVAHPGKPISIDAQSFEVYVPIDPNVLLAEQADSVSEEVQMMREVRGTARETLVPLGLGGMAMADRKDARASAERITEMESAAAVEMETLRSAERQSASRDPVILTIPEGGSAQVLRTGQ